MSIKISFKERAEAEKFILISIIGLTESLLKKSISIENAENALFSPYSSHILKQEGITPNIIELVDAGCELEDIASLLPDRLDYNITKIKEQAVSELLQRSEKKDMHEIKKWLDK